MEKSFRQVCLNPQTAGFHKIASIGNWDFYTTSQKIQSDLTLAVAFDTSRSCQEFRLAIPSVLLASPQERDAHLLQKLVSNRLIDTSDLEPKSPA